MKRVWSTLTSKRTWWPALVLPLLLAFATASYGQGRAALSGNVVDSEGALIPSATVTITLTSTGEKTLVNTNASGAYVFASLPAANYSISVSAAGFKTVEQQGIVLQADQSVTVNLTLQPGSQSQSVEVNADTTPVDTTTGTLSQVIGEKKRE